MNIKLYSKKIHSSAQHIISVCLEAKPESIHDTLEMNSFDLL